MRATGLALACFTASDTLIANAKMTHTHQRLSVDPAGGFSAEGSEEGTTYKTYWHYNYVNNTLSGKKDTLLGGWVQDKLQLNSGDLDVPDNGAHKKHTLYSQAGQDWLVATILGCQKSGYFVELAANDAFRWSNSAFLERDLGWQGICIDANPEYVDGYRRRKCQFFLAGVGEKEKEMEFALRAEMSGYTGPGLDNQAGSDARTMKVKTVPLAEILKKAKAPKEIDYFSLDVEGGESVVMHGFPWDEYKFRAISVERPKEDVKTALEQNGYEFVRTEPIWGDQLWLNKEAVFGTKEKPLTLHQIKKRYAQGVVKGFEDSCMKYPPFNLDKPDSLYDGAHDWPSSLLLLLALLLLVTLCLVVKCYMVQYSGRLKAAGADNEPDDK